MKISQAEGLIYLCEVDKLIKRVTRGNDLSRLTISKTELRVLYLAHPDLNSSFGRQFDKVEIAMIVDISEKMVSDILIKLKRILPPSLATGLH